MKFTILGLSKEKYKEYLTQRHKIINIPEEIYDYLCELKDLGFCVDSTSKRKYLKDTIEFKYTSGEDWKKSLFSRYSDNNRFPAGTKYTVEDLYLRYGNIKGMELWNEYISRQKINNKNKGRPQKSSINLEAFNNRHGIELGYIQYKKFCKRQRIIFHQDLLEKDKCEIFITCFREDNKKEFMFSDEVLSVWFNIIKNGLHYTRFKMLRFIKNVSTTNIDNKHIEEYFNVLHPGVKVGFKCLYGKSWKTQFDTQIKLPQKGKGLAQKRDWKYYLSYHDYDKTLAWNIYSKIKRISNKELYYEIVVEKEGAYDDYCKAKAKLLYPKPTNYVSSRISHDMFVRIEKEFPKYTFKYYRENKDSEFYIKDEQDTYKYDFVCEELKLCIEYNGRHVHPNPHILTKFEWEEWRHVWNKGLDAYEAEAYDNYKVALIEDLGYIVYVAWDHIDIDIHYKTIVELINNIKDDKL